VPYASCDGFLSMIILIIQVEDFSFSLVDFERDPPVAGDGQAPAPLAVPGELMAFQLGTS